jgi:chitinase
MKTFSVILLFLVTTVVTAKAQPGNFHILAYYAAGPERVDSLAAEKLTHIIYSFCHLKGNQLVVDNERDSTTIVKLVGLKKRNARLKIILSLGGWGGCETCSQVFSTADGRKEFSESVLSLSQRYHTDGLDLDWEYPAIEGYPGHRYVAEDRQNFTGLVKDLRSVLGTKYEISFAAGGFQKFLEESVEWPEVMKVVDRVNLMSYDLINGYSTTTGHHTALYSTDKQKESTDNAVKYLIKIGVPRNKIVIGAAFYARIWENVDGENNGLYQSGKFKWFTDFRKFPEVLTAEKGFKMYWDEKASAPYAYNEKEKLFATYDDPKSLRLKTRYALEQRLDGIMFWEIALDKNDELVNAIYKAKERPPVRK